MDTNEENESPPVRGQYNQDQDRAIDLDDDTDFVEETRVRARSKTPSHRHSLKGTSFFEQACASITKYYENKVDSSSRSKESEDPYSIKRCVELPSNIPDVSGVIYMKAFQVIGSNPSWRELFISASEHIRPMMLDSSNLDHHL